MGSEDMDFTDLTMAMAITMAMVMVMVTDPTDDGEGIIGHHFVLDFVSVKNNSLLSWSIYVTANLT